MRENKMIQEGPVGPHSAHIYSHGLVIFYCFFFNENILY